MKFNAGTLFTDAWRAWRADWDILTALAGVFVFVPILGVRLMLSPELERLQKLVDPADTQRIWSTFFQWTADNLHWLATVQVLSQFAITAILLLYLDSEKMKVGGAMRRAISWLPFYLLLAVIVSIVSAVGFLFLIIGYFYCLARLIAAGPAMIAERNHNPFAAIARSLALTRGHGLTLTAAVMIVLLGAALAQVPFDAIDSWIASSAPNPIARAMVDAIGAGIATASVVAMTLIQVAAYRRLSSS